MNGNPDWTCAECGSSGPFHTVEYDVPGEPREYDLQCNVCSSTDIRESSREAANVLGDRLDTAKAEVEHLRQALVNKEQVAMLEREACARMVLNFPGAFSIRGLDANALAAAIRARGGC